MNFIQACNLDCQSSNSLKKVERAWCRKNPEKLHREKESTILEYLGEFFFELVSTAKGYHFTKHK